MLDTAHSSPTIPSSPLSSRCLTLTEVAKELGHYTKKGNTTIAMFAARKCGLLPALKMGTVYYVDRSHVESIKLVTEKRAKLSPWIDLRTCVKDLERIRVDVLAGKRQVRWFRNYARGKFIWSGFVSAMAEAYKPTIPNNGRIGGIEVDGYNFEQLQARTRKYFNRESVGVQLDSLPDLLSDCIEHAEMI